MEAVTSNERDGGNQPKTPRLVWVQEDRWSWFSECGNYRIERFVTGEHESVGHDFVWPDRYRAFKHSPEWYGEIGNEPTLDDAKRVCQEAVK